MLSLIPWPIQYNRNPELRKMPGWNLPLSNRSRYCIEKGRLQDCCGDCEIEREVRPLEPAEHGMFMKNVLRMVELTANVSRSI